MNGRELILTSMAMILAGCADQSFNPREEAATSRAGVAPASAAPKAAFLADASANQGAPGDKAESATKQATANRKIIYNATVELVTEDLGKLENALIRIHGQRVSNMLL